MKKFTLITPEYHQMTPCGEGVYMGALIKAGLLLGAIIVFSDQAHAQANKEADPSNTDIVVTAEKREGSLLTTPVPVTFLQASALSATSKVSIADYYDTVPGLNAPTSAFGSPVVFIRGLSTGAVSNPTAGTVIDDISVGASSSNAYGFEVPDLNPSDLSSIEVLRGPQGTLYGASSLGGSSNIIPSIPGTISREGWKGR